MCYGENLYNYDHEFWSLDCEEYMTPDEIAAAEYEHYLSRQEASENEIAAAEYEQYLSRQEASETAK